MIKINFTAQQKKAIIGGVVALVLALFGVSASTVTSSPAKKPAKQKKEIAQSSVRVSPEQFYSVTRVIDGDTFIVSVDGQSVTVRSLGINTPETVDPRRPVQCFGKEASAKAKEILSSHGANIGTSTTATSTRVRLETDPTQDAVDRYDRLLAYVFIENGPLFNKYMIEEGYAYEYTYDKPYARQQEFKKAENDARTHHRGLWKDTVCPVKEGDPKNK